MIQLSDRQEQDVAASLARFRAALAKLPVSREQARTMARLIALGAAREDSRHDRRNAS